MCTYIQWHLNTSSLFPVKPTLFILFILSHGDADGKIMTDHKLEGTEDYETFTTASVFEALNRNKRLNDALKLVFLGVSFSKPYDVHFSKVAPLIFDH